MMRKEIEKIIHEVLYHDSWESKDNETIHDKSTDQICSLFIERLEKIQKDFDPFDDYTCDELNNLIKELKGE